MEKSYDMVIVGGGPGGYTAALYAARAGLSAVVLERMSAGGQMAQTHMIDNYPGFHEGIDGYQLGEQMRMQAERFGAETVFTQVNSMELAEEIKKIRTDSGDYLGRTVVYAAGAGPKKLGLPMEEELVGRGVAYCAACDGMFYRGKTVVVVGGGNSAAADALLLSRVAGKVILVHRRDAFRAAKAEQLALQKAENVEYLMNSQVIRLEHERNLTGVVVRTNITGEELQIPCDGIFISIGRKPAAELVAGQLEMDAAGYLLAGEDTKTNIPGVYAVGDVRSKPVRQIVTATSDGAVAVAMAEQYLAE